MIAGGEHMTLLSFHAYLVNMLRQEGVADDTTSCIVHAIHHLTQKIQTRLNSQQAKQRTCLVLAVFLPDGATLLYSVVQCLKIFQVFLVRSILDTKHRITPLHLSTYVLQCDY